MGKDEIKVHLLSVSTIASIHKNTFKFWQNVFNFNKIKTLFVNSSNSPWKKDTIGNNFGIVKICLPSKIMLRKI